MSTQSPLVPHGSEAEALAALIEIVIGGGVVVFAIVLVIAALALRARGRPSPWLSERALVVGGGIVFPTAVLVALLGGTLLVDRHVGAASAGAPLRIEVIGEMWWWRVHYLDAAGRATLATANELHVPVGGPVELQVSTADVIHSFWVPGLARQGRYGPGPHIR